MDGLNTVWLGRKFMNFVELDSTNTYLKENADKLPHGTAVTADRQTSGKGRLGRNWQDGGLCLSFLLHGQSSEKLPALPLVVGVASVLAFERLTSKGFSLKWSNDVLYNDKKLAGILCESRISGSGAFAVAGIGVNINQDRGDFDRLGLVYATSLKLATGETCEILPVAHAILNEFEPLFENFSKNSFAGIRDIYKSRCATLGREVRVITGETETTGLAVDIAEDGGLILETNSGLRTVRAGEASVRGLYGYV